MTSIKSYDFRAGSNRPSSHDIRLDSRGNLALVTGQEEIRERVTCGLIFRRGENPYDTTYGIDHAYLAQRPAHERPLIGSTIAAWIRRRPGVTSASVRETTLDRVTRQLSVSFDIETAEGTFIIST